MDFRQKVIYQIYPKSFYDSDGDGLGDLRGIIEKVPYLQSLGIDMVWLNPFFVSPQRDNGYDVADYRAVDPRFGTMADFEELVAVLKSVGIGIMLDMVFNHTSTTHPWFQAALAGDEKYQAYYLIEAPKPDGSLPTNWQSKFGGPAWAPFGTTGKYYLHLYDQSQTDLNWRNPAVRNECAQIINFWRQKGVQGFRFDVINVIGKPEPLMDAIAGTDGRTRYTDQPVVETYLKQLNQMSFGRDPEIVTVGELSSTTMAASVAYTKPQNHELNMAFNFHHLKVDYDHGQKWTDQPVNYRLLKETLTKWETNLAADGGWPALFWNNHDQPRALDRFGDVGRYRVQAAEMLANVVHLSRGTPFVYQGEELGMSDPEYTSMDDYVDVEAHNAYQALLTAGKSPATAFRIVQRKARDNSRTPMQWQNDVQAGFTTGTPWLRATNQAIIHQGAPMSQQIFSYYQRLIALRHTFKLISDGDFLAVPTVDDDVYGFERRWGTERLLVVANFSGHTKPFQVPRDYLDARVLISNYVDAKPNDQILQPYQSTAFYVGNHLLRGD
ncbi:alpha,alpha-phosphotrehalase [Furfurilactobacillus entadae]|uniref:alpha,alpha-phosphotrehalase n=1 Tax=Furfurilactobacillus entadae TaxID=2922307 RepID=UPI0035EC86A7